MNEGEKRLVDAMKRDEKQGSPEALHLLRHEIVKAHAAQRRLYDPNRPLHEHVEWIRNERDAAWQDAESLRTQLHGQALAKADDIALAVAAEREACALIGADEMITAIECARRIRARTTEHAAERSGGANVDGDKQRQEPQPPAGGQGSGCTISGLAEFNPPLSFTPGLTEARVSKIVLAVVKPTLDLFSDWHIETKKRLTALERPTCSGSLCAGCGKPMEFNERDACLISIGSDGKMWHPECYAGRKTNTGGGKPASSGMDVIGSEDQTQPVRPPPVPLDREALAQKLRLKWRDAEDLGNNGWSAEADFILSLLAEERKRK